VAGLLNVVRGWAFVNAARKFISFRYDHCAREQGLAARDVVPFIPKATDRKHTGVRSTEVVGRFRAVDRSPLVVTRCWNNATSVFESGAKHRLFGDDFAAAVKCGRNLLERFLPPARHETSTHRHEFACPIAHADCHYGRSTLFPHLVWRWLVARSDKAILAI
jgi:hypothetical protein